MFCGNYRTHPKKRKRKRKPQTNISEETDTNFFRKSLVHRIQQLFKKIIQVIKWDLILECKIGSIEENPSCNISY